jgi:general secretion pathway protein D
MVAIICLLAANAALGQEEKAEEKPSEAKSSESKAPTPQPSPPPEKPKLLSVSFKNAGIDQIAKFLSEKLGKPVIPHADVMKTKINLVNTKQYELTEALQVLYDTLLAHGVVVQENHHTVHLVSIASARQGHLPTLDAATPLSSIVNKATLVNKIFELKHYDTGKLMEVLKPMLPSFGHMTADPVGRSISVIDSVGHLEGLERIIIALDVESGRDTVMEVIELTHADPVELTATLRTLLAEYLGARKSRKGGGAVPQAAASPGGAKPGGASASAVTIGSGDESVLLMPDSLRGGIVVVASPAIIAKVHEWVAIFDVASAREAPFEIVTVSYGAAEEIATKLSTFIASMPDRSLREAIKINSVSATRLAIIGSKQNRQMVRDLLREVDVPDTDPRLVKTFTLAYADADKVKENIEELFAKKQQSVPWYYPRSRSQQPVGRDAVTATANRQQNSVTVVAAPEKMERIEKQINEVWDTPPEHDVAPKTYNLKYSDPEKVREMLDDLFGGRRTTWSNSFFGDQTREEGWPVGRLYGQFKFVAYAELGRLMVVSRSAANYEIIDRIIEQIDQPQVAGIPKLIPLKHANAEEMAEQVNALLNAPGTPASILRLQSGRAAIDQIRVADPTETEQEQDGRIRQQQNAPTSPDSMIFWWQTRPRNIEERPPSSLVGQMRVVPVARQNALMVVGAEQYTEELVRLIHDLDQPGHQVLIKAVIVEISHDDLTSLGFRFSTDPTVFTTGDTEAATQNAIRGLVNYQFQDMYGQQHALTVNVDVNALVSALQRVVKLNIRSEPKIFTADNQEAQFFDGQDVPRVTESRSSAEATTLTQTFEYRPVGIRLRVRPHITEQREVDLAVNLEISSVADIAPPVPGAVTFNRRETTTHVVLRDRQTLMISGILRSEDVTVRRKVPGFGDIPLVGLIFQHREVVKANTELLIFLTPYVLSPDDVEGSLDDALEETEAAPSPSQPEGDAPPFTDP